jgi:type IV pilus assembly protein PilF
MSMITIMKNAIVMVCLITITACATSPWNKEQADVHMNVGIAYLGGERYTDALKEFLQAENIIPRDPKVHYYMGIAYFGKELNDKAIEEFNKALSLQSDYSEAYNYLGYIYLRTGRWDDAIESFKKALTNILYETPEKAFFNMGKAYHGKGDYPMALSSYEKAKNIKPNTVPLPLLDLHMGVTYYTKGDLEKAVQHFKASIKMAPSLLESRYWLGQCYIKQRDFEKAKAEFKAIIESAPESELAKAARKSLDSIHSR